MMDKHAFYIMFAYGITAIAISAITVAIIADYQRLRSALTQFPPRAGDLSE